MVLGSSKAKDISTAFSDVLPPLSKRERKTTQHTGQNRVPGQRDRAVLKIQVCSVFRPVKCQEMLNGPRVGRKRSVRRLFLSDYYYSEFVRYVTVKLVKTVSTLP